MTEYKLGLECENCGTVYKFQNFREKGDKKCRYCGCPNLIAVEMIVK